MIPIIKIPVKIPIAPRRSGFDRWFWESLERGIFETTHCSNCARISFPPRKHCPDCHNSEYELFELRGSGVLYTRTTVRMVPTRLIPFAPLSLGVVDLDEGVRVACALRDRDKPLRIGDRIQMVAMKFDDGVLFAAQAETQGSD